MHRIAQLQLGRFGTTPLTLHVLGTAFLVVTAASVTATRGIAVLLPVLAGLVVLVALYERAPLRPFLRIPPTTAAFGLLLLYALLSTTWGFSPLHAIPHVLSAMLMLVSAHALTAWIGEQDEPRLKHLVFWVIVAFAAGLVWLTFDVLGQQPLKRWFVNTFEALKPQAANKHYEFDHTGYVWLSLSDLNHNIAALNLLLWPVLMCVSLFWGGTKRRAIIAGLFATALLCTFASEHETSKLAVIAAAATYVIARQSLPAAKRLMLAGWGVALLATIPIALFAYHGLGLQNADWLQVSGRERVVIWADIAQRTYQNPIFGAGARSTNKLNSLGTAALTKSDDRKDWKIGRHPHNVYLQTWYELGFVGVLLLGAAGLIAFSQATQLPAFTQPFVFAALTSIAVELALCWDIWQRWFFALLCFTTAMLVLALRWASLQPMPKLQRDSG